VVRSSRCFCRQNRVHFTWYCCNCSAYFLTFFPFCRLSIKHYTNTAIAAESFNNLVRGERTEDGTTGINDADKDLHRNRTYDVDVEEGNDV
jgi:hypothetical protein